LLLICAAISCGSVPIQPENKTQAIQIADIAVLSRLQFPKLKSFAVIKDAGGKAIGYRMDLQDGMALDKFKAAYEVLQRRVPK
jgi:hypothetical protein